MPWRPSDGIDSTPFRYAFGHLGVNPAIGLFHSCAQGDRWRPAEALLDERVVAVAAADALGRVQLVPALQAYAGDFLDDIDELVDGDQLVASEVQRLRHVARHDAPCTGEAVIDVHEAASLPAVAP